MSEKLIFEIELDEDSLKKGFVNIKKQSDDTFGGAGRSSGKEFSDSFSGNLGGIKKDFDSVIGSIVGRVGIAAGAIGAALYGAFSIVRSGELEAQVTKQFDFLAAQAGLVGESLRESFEKAGGGLAEMSDVLKASNSALMELGDSAKRLPEILDLARRVSLTTGQDMIQVFDQINYAISSGNSRALKSVSIFLDNQKVQSDFAKTLGTTAEKLTLAGNQQAVLNAVLDVGKNKFKEIDDNAQKATIANKRLTVALSELFGELSKSVAQSQIGKFFENMGNAFTNSINNMRKSLEDKNNPAKQLEFLNKEIERLSKNEAYLKGLKPGEYVSALGVRAGEALQKLEGLRTKQAELSASIAKSDAENTAAVVNGSEQRKSALVEEAKVIEDLTLKNQNFAFYSIAAISDISLSWQTFSGALAEQASSMKTTMGEMAKMAMTTLAGGVGTAIKQMVLAIRQGKNGMQAFGEAFVNILGEVAVKMGSVYLAEAAVMFFSPNPVDNAKAPGLAAAAAGLIAIGTLMSASVGGGDTQGIGASPIGAAGGGGGFEVSAPLTPSPDAEVRQAGPVVNLTIQGDVFDSDQTSLRIARLLETGFQEQGLVVRGMT